MELLFAETSRITRGKSTILGMLVKSDIVSACGCSMGELDEAKGVSHEKVWESISAGRENGPGTEASLVCAQQEGWGGWGAWQGMSSERWAGGRVTEGPVEPAAGFHFLQR